MGTEDMDLTAARLEDRSPAAASRSREDEVYDYGIVEHIGEITLPGDGRKVFGIVMSFPGEPPALRLSDVWNRTPFRLKPAAAAGREVETCRMPTRPLCARCNRYITIDTDADDDLWTEVIGERFGPGYICADCFTRAADERLIEWGDKVRFVPITLASQAEVQEKARSRLQPAAAAEAPCAEGVSKHEE